MKHDFGNIYKDVHAYIVKEIRSVHNWIVDAQFRRENVARRAHRYTPMHFAAKFSAAVSACAAGTNNIMADARMGSVARGKAHWEGGRVLPVGARESDNGAVVLDTCMINPT